jgi:hypothetical protein
VNKAARTVLVLSRWNPQSQRVDEDRERSCDVGDTPLPKKITELKCSFCNKKQNDVRKLIAGPAVFICNDCVNVCVEIIADDARFTPGPTIQEPAQASVPLPAAAMGSHYVRCSLCRMPVAVEDALPVVNRGALCPGCVGEIRAAAAEKEVDVPGGGSN